MSENKNQFNVSLNEEQSILQQSVRQFAENEIKPFVLELDEAQKFPIDIVEKMGNAGFLGATIPEQYDGSGMSISDFVIIMKEISKIDASIGLILAAHHGLCLSHLFSFSNEEQKKKYIPELATGKKIGAWCLTEPFSGSDASGMKSRAVKNGDYYILNVTKNFITNASYTSTFVVICIVENEGKKKHTAFIVEKNYEGVSIAKKENKLGMRASDTAQVVFSDVKVPIENRLGEEGDGFKQSLKVLDGGRIGIAALSLGIIEGCLEASIKYAKERNQFGKSLSEFQATQWKIADMSTQLEAAKFLTFQAAYLKDNGKPFGKEASYAKLFASELACSASSEAIQIHGGYGYIKEFPVEKFYRDAKLLTIGEGTSEIQRLVIARYLLNEI